MKSIIFVALAFVAVACAAPVGPPVEPLKIIRSDFQQQPDGSYSFSFETEDGTIREEFGQLKQITDEDNKPVTILVVTGRSTYINDQGKTETINYQADENGFQAQGESVPKSLAARR